ncbi:hypothetical protein QEN19_003666 [Hanseniaspora menglaensis]
MGVILSLKAIFFIYFFGGITFIPIIFITLYYILPNKKLSYSIKDEDSIIDPNFKLGEFNELKNVNVTKQGLMSVISKYNKTILKDKKDETGLEQLGVDTASFNKLKNNSNFFVKLIHGNLILYSENTSDSSISDDESTSLNTMNNGMNLRKILKVISLKDVIVTMWPPNLTEGSIFTKKSSILVVKKNLYDSETKKFKLLSGSDQFTNNSIWFLQLENNFDKEDWYFEMLNALKGLNTESKDNFGYIESFGKFIQEPPETYHFSTASTNRIIALNNSNLEHVNCKWFNLIISRLFLAYKANGKLENVIATKIKEKLSKFNVSFLDEFEINDLKVGDAAPIISNPKVLQMNLEGDLEIELDIVYDSHFVLNISTLITILNKTYPIELKVDLKKIKGTILLKFKKPPSNRIWYTFTKTPSLDLEIEPVIVNKSFSYGMVVKTLKSKIMDALKDSLVYPKFEDINYYKMENNHSIYKGGLWDFTNMNDYLEAFIKSSEVECEENLRRTQSLSEEKNSVYEKSQDEDTSQGDENAKDIDTETIVTSNTTSNLQNEKKTFRDLLKRKTNSIQGLSQETNIDSDLTSLSSNDSGNKNYKTKINSWYKKTKKAAAIIIDEKLNDKDSEKVSKDYEIETEKVTYADDQHINAKEIESNHFVLKKTIDHTSESNSSISRDRATSESNTKSSVRKEVFEKNKNFDEDTSNPFELYQQSKLNNKGHQDTLTTIDDPPKYPSRRRPLPPLPLAHDIILHDTDDISGDACDKSKLLNDGREDESNLLNVDREDESNLLSDDQVDEEQTNVKEQSSTINQDNEKQIKSEDLLSTSHQNSEKETDF